MAKPPLDFPLSAVDLDAMPNAHLVQLVKQVPSPHPQIKSLAHFMSKTDKISYLQAQHYGHALDVAHILPAAEKKYAGFLAKAKAKSAAPKVPSGANCAATAMKTLSSLADDVAEEIPKLNVVAADIEQWAAAHLDLVPDDVAQIEGFLTQLKNVETTYADEALKNTYDEALKNVRAAINDTPIADVATFQYHAKALDNVAVIFDDNGGFGSQLKVLSAQMKAKAEKASADYLAQSDFGASMIKTFTGAKQSVDEMIPTLKSAADLEAAQLTPNMVNDTQMLLKALTKDLADALDTAVIDSGLADEIIDAAASVPVSITNAAAELQAALKALGEKALAKGKDDAWKIHQAGFDALDNVTLKKMAYDELASHGYQKSLGSFLTKTEKVELLSKMKAGQPVDDLVDVAKQKYLAKEAASKGKPFAPTSVKTPQQIAADSKLNPAHASFDVEAAIDAAGEQHLVPPTQFPKIETTPKPKPKVKHVFTSTGEVPNGGSHQLEWFTDEDGNRWLFKVQGKVLSDIEEFAAEIGERLGLEMAEVATEQGVQTTFYGVVDGTFQRAFAHKGEIEKVYGIGGAVDPTRLAVAQLEDIQRQQVLDWLISNHDNHGSNMLVGLDGRLLPIDKGQTFKFFGNDLLNATYNPNASPTVYQSLWRSVLKGDTKVDFDYIDDIITRVEQIPTDEYRRLVRAAVEEKYRLGGGKVTAYLPAKMHEIDAFVDAAVKRKETIRADFEIFYSDIANRTGVEWTPKWAARPVISDTAKHVVTKGDIVTPITPELAKGVQQTNSAGKALHLAGEEINEGQALVWQETGVDGSKILRMELRLERQADARVTQLFEDAAGIDSSATSYVSPAAPADPLGVIQLAAKTVNHHVTKGDFTPDAGKIQAMLKVNEDLFKAIDAADAADQQIASGLISKDEWALLKAKGEQATHYKQTINDIQDGIQFQHKVDHVAPFDVDAAKARYLAQAPDVGSPPPSVLPTSSGPPKLFTDTPKIGNEHVDATMEGPGYLERKRIGAQQRQVESGGYHPPGEVSMSQGKQFNAIVDVGGQKIKVTWSSWNMTASYPSKSKMTMELLDWDGSDLGIEQMLTALQRLGVDSHLATAQDEALTYWQVITGQMKNSVEYAEPSAASGPYAQLRATLDRIEKKIADEALSTEAKVAIYREELGKTFGADSIAGQIRRGESISHVHDLHGNEVGYGFFERFDLPDDLGPFYRQAGKQWGIARKSRIDTEILTDSWGSLSNGEKIRLGWPSASGTSGSADLGTGGGTGSFASMGMTHWQGHGPIVLINPSSIARRGSTFNAGSDTFGRIWYRTDRHADGGGNWLNPSEWGRYIGRGPSDGTKEVVARGGYSFYDDVEIMFTQSARERDALIKVLKDQGVTELRGLPIEERIVISTHAKMPDAMDSFFKDHPEAYRHRYSEPELLKTTGKQASGAPLTPQPVVPSTAPPGTNAAAKDAYTSAFDGLSQTKNSVKSKITHTVTHLKANGVKTTEAQLQAEFDLWWEAKGNYQGVTQVKSFKTFLAHKIGQHQIADTLETLGTAAEKMAALDAIPLTYAKQLAIEDLFSSTWKQLTADFKTLGGTGYTGGPEFKKFLIDKAIALDNASATAVDAADAVLVFPKSGVKLTPKQAQKVYDDFFGPNATSIDLEKTIKEATGQPFLNSQLLNEDIEKIVSEVSNSFDFHMSKKLLDIANTVPTSAAPTAATAKLQYHATGGVMSHLPTVAADVGKKATTPDIATKIFDYNVNGTKVSVVYQKTAAGGTNILVKDQGEWFLLKPTHKGKTTKDEILLMLEKVGHSATEPF